VCFGLIYDVYCAAFIVQIHSENKSLSNFAAFFLLYQSYLSAKGPTQKVHFMSIWVVFLIE